MSEASISSPNAMRTDNTSDPDPFRFPTSTPASRERDLWGNEPPRDLVDWSHRKGEPRVFALLWMIYLLLATAMMFASLASGYTVAPRISRPITREMLVVVIFGMAVLWPLVRLSQTIAPPSVVASSVRDMIVILIPLQAILWPVQFIVLGGWSFDVVLALSAHFAAWALVIAGLISLGSILIARSSNSYWVRVCAMFVVLVAIFVVPLIELISLKGASVGMAHANLGWMLSPMTGVLEITADRGPLGQPAVVFSAHFRIIAAVACVGLALLLFGKALENTNRVAYRRGRS